MKIQIKSGFEKKPKVYYEVLGLLEEIRPHLAYLDSESLKRARKSKIHNKEK